MSLRPADAARPLRFWRVDQLRELGRLLEQALRPWAGEWGLDESAAAVDCHRARSHADAARDGFTLRSEERLAWLAPGSWTAALAQELFGAPVGPGGIGGEVARACADDATRRLAQALGMLEVLPEPQASPPLPCRGDWGGEVQARLSFGGVLLLNGAAVEACLRRNGKAAKPGSHVPARAPVAMPLLQAAAAQRLSLRVQLAPCEVDLGVLQDLQPGDVLRIPHRLDLPLQVSTESGAALFTGYLAGSRGRKVLELAAAP